MARKQKKELSMFEWECLVAAWRYYEHRSTIAAAKFPEDLVVRYFQGDYKKETVYRIAYQFAKTDHGLRGVEDWNWDEHPKTTKWKNEYHPWLKFYAFCNAWVDGFKKMVVVDPETGKKKKIEAFHLDTVDRWYPVKRYLEKPFFEIWIPRENIIQFGW